VTAWPSCSLMSIYGTGKTTASNKYRFEMAPSVQRSAPAGSSGIVECLKPLTVISSRNCLPFPDDAMTTGLREQDEKKALARPYSADL
jgi:hypothetical protein